MATMIADKLPFNLEMGRLLEKGQERHGRACHSYGSRELALIEIDWTKSDKTLLLYIAAWLREHRTISARPDVGRGVGNFLRKCADELKALGAMRLLQAMKREERDWTDAVALSGNALYGQHQQTWTAAYKKAARILDSLAKNVHMQKADG